MRSESTLPSILCNGLLIRCEVDSEMVPSDYRVIGIGCDVSSELSVQQAFRKVMDTYGRIDSVVASAGMSRAFTGSVRTLMYALQASLKTTLPLSACLTRPVAGEVADSFVRQLPIRPDKASV